MVEAALAFSSPATASWYSVVLRRSFCVLVVPSRAADLAAKPRFLPLGLRAGHRRPRPLEAVQSSLHQVIDRYGDQGSGSFLQMSEPSESTFQLCGRCNVAGCVRSLSTHVCAEIQLVGVRQAGQAQTSVLWCWFDVFCCGLLVVSRLVLLLLE